MRSFQLFFAFDSPRGGREANSLPPPSVYCPLLFQLLGHSCIYASIISSSSLFLQLVDNPIHGTLPTGLTTLLSWSSLHRASVPHSPVAMKARQWRSYSDLSLPLWDGQTPWPGLESPYRTPNRNRPFSPFPDQDVLWTHTLAQSSSTYPSWSIYNWAQANQTLAMCKHGQLGASLALSL